MANPSPFADSNTDVNESSGTTRQNLRRYSSLELEPGLGFIELSGLLGFLTQPAEFARFLVEPFARGKNNYGA